MTVLEAEEIAVDTCNRRIRRETLLHRRDLLAPENRVVRQNRLQRVQTRWLRRGDDVEHHGTVRRELDLAGVDDTGKQRLSADGCRGEAGSRDYEKPCKQGPDDGSTNHDPGRE
jgi:hypothetical protein